MKPVGVPAELLREMPHLPGFLPGWDVVPPARHVPLFTLPGAAGPWPGARLHAWPCLWQSPRFGQRQAPVALVVAPAPSPAGMAETEALRCLPGPGDAGDAMARDHVALLRDARVGATPGLPDPGAAALGLARGGAVLVVDPCDPSRRAAARAMLAAARASAPGDLLLVRSPAAPAAAPMVLADAPEARLDRPLAPWSLIDSAAALHVLDEEVGMLARLAGVPVQVHAPAWWNRPGDGLDVLRALLAALRCVDPFRGCPWTPAQAVQQLADWRMAEVEHRRIHAATGLEVFKRRRIRAALAHAQGEPAIFWRASRAIAAARAAGGAVAVWSGAMPACLPSRAARGGVPLVQLEDGFIRSSGLGVLLAPAASYAVDLHGMHYDPSVPSGLERILAETAFDPALLLRAAALRQALIAAGVTKYNLRGDAVLPPLPPGRRLLVVGQVEDDAAMLRGGARLRSNLALLQAVRAEQPDAVILYKPHPDVEAGMRRGAIPPGQLRRLADAVLADTPITPLYGMVEEVHCIASLAGFEALLRGCRVVTHGRPFYAGWGLTTDRDPPPRRGRPLLLDELVAGALILYPRYWDPSTGLPCAPELLLERIAAKPPPSPPRLPAWLRARVARASVRITRWLAAR